ncbi:hypothetical protein F2Q70_00036919 [Brassica cretica]|uniref:E2 ubiquitin-conjugating enzyme n=1 Tax=Brassica cretica TaxID=69181 RepID=A0A8S9JUT1_BRACR|nr:hypothetical protein F2Q70_00036919 [Brassica cretica]
MAAVNGYQGNTPAETTPAATGSKQPAPPAKTVDSQSVLKRLQSELMGLMMGGDPGISAFPEEDNIFCWKGTITGSKDTVFEGTEYRLSLAFSNDYPFKPPKVKFETCCFHPNVDLYGNICLDILQDKWSSAYDVRTILLSIQSLLGEPNISSPLNNQAAQLWSNQEGMAAVNGYQGYTPAPAATGSKQPAPPSKTVDSQSVLKRLQSELMGLMMGGDPGISAFPEEDNIFCWKGTITGSNDTVFEGTEYRLSLAFSNDYPFKPPKVKFETCCFHPNVDLYGNICLDILQDKWSSAYDVRTILLSIQSLLGGNTSYEFSCDKWSSAYDVRTILLSIQSLLGEPNISSPLNNQAAQLWSNQEEYRKMVEKLYKPLNP